MHDKLFADFIARMDRGEMDGHLTEELQTLSYEDLIKVCAVLMGRVKPIDSAT